MAYDMNIKAAEVIIHYERPSDKMQLGYRYLCGVNTLKDPL